MEIAVFCASGGALVADLALILAYKGVGGKERKKEKIRVKGRVRVKVEG